MEDVMRPPKALIVLAVLVAVACLHPVFAGTTGKIIGTVIDKDSKKPIPGAGVIIKGTDMSAVADSVCGCYLFLNVLPGKYTLIVEHIGYKKMIIDSVEALIDITNELNIELEAAANDTDSIIIIAPKFKIEKFDSTVVERLSQSEIESLRASDSRGIIKFQTGSVTKEGANPEHGSRAEDTVLIDDGVFIRDELGGH
jgi:hypothetical protein